LHAILAVSRLDGGAMYRWQESEKLLRLFAWRGLSEAFVRQATVIRRGSDALVDAVLEGETRLVDDFSVLPGGGREPAQAGFRAAILCPVWAQGQTVGLLALGRYRTRPFESADVDLIEVIANQIGIATVKAQLVKDLEQKNNLLELLIEEAHHRIKNNLQMISGLLQLEVTEAEEAGYADRLHHAISRIQAIAQVHHLLSQEMPEKVDANVLITKIVKTLAGSLPMAEAPQMALNLEHLWLDADQAVALSLIVNELVANALLHGAAPAGQPLSVAVSCRPVEGNIVVIVSDNGGGIPANRTPRPDGGQGMNIVNQLAQVNLRGELNVANSAGGVRATLRFPRSRQADRLAR
jgi:two-component sensor histidine kinase/putative methionine-R-sulfoxide reductase with GAF domain